MPATIISEPSFAAGNLALLESSLNTTDYGLVTVRARFACLGSDAVVQRNLAQFGRHAPFPLALTPASLRNTPLERGTVFLVDCETRTENGLCYFDANYSGIAEPRRVVQTQASQSRSFVGLFSYTLDLGANVANVEAFGTISFDYDSVTTSTVTCSFINAPFLRPAGFTTNIRRIVRQAVRARGGSGAGLPPLDKSESYTTETVGAVYIIRETGTAEYGSAA
jgi:hypothetical protein